jgi:glycerate kinase
MRYLIGPDSFKDSVSANEFCLIAKEVFTKHWPDDEVVYLPLADGGEGTVDALVYGQKGEFVTVKVTDPLGHKIDANYGLIDDKKTAIIEMAAASGLPLVSSDKQNPMVTTTYGTGEMIVDAIKKDVSKIIIGIGGSATSDAGLGMLQALGFQCMDKKGEEVGFGGKALNEVAKIVRPMDAKGDFLFRNIDILVACDVTSPLYGKEGAAYVYGPQKGATVNMVIELDKGLLNFAKVVQTSLGKDVHSLSGGGAAGGLGACLYAALDAEVKPGFEIISGLVGLRTILSKGIDYIITAEGQMNEQSFNGKLPVELAKLGKEFGANTIAVVGAKDVASERMKQFGIIGVFPIANGPITLEQSMMHGKELIKETLVNILSLLHA